ncbi:unnamed protein product [Caenorhabditis nigoni]
MHGFCDRRENKFTLGSHRNRKQSFLEKSNFLVTEDKCCPGNAILGIDFMAAIEEKGKTTSIRPASNKLRIGEESIELVAPTKKIYEVINSVVEITSAENALLEPERTCSIKVKNSPNSSEENLETTLSVRNVPSTKIQINTGDVIASRKSSTASVWIDSCQEAK